MPKAFVYFILSTKSWLIKVGTSREPLRRMAAIQSTEGAPVLLVAIHEFTQKPSFMPDVYSEERRFHTILEPWRVSGEWFDISIEHVQTAINHIRAENRAVAGGFPFKGLMGALERWPRGHRKPAKPIGEHEALVLSEKRA